MKKLLISFTALFLSLSVVGCGESKAEKNFNTAVEKVKKENASLDKDINKAQKLVKSRKQALDESLRATLKTTIKETKDSKYKIKDKPDKDKEIKQETNKMNKYDYQGIKNKLETAYNNLDISMKKYKLVDQPQESYVIECLKKVNGIMDIEAVTEQNDPNKQLNKAGGYTSQVYFSSNLIDQNSIEGNTVIDKGTDCGGSIEVYKTSEDAHKRNDYLSAFDGGILSSGSHTVYGTVVIRTSNALTATQQKQLESDILNALTAL